MLLGLIVGIIFLTGFLAIMAVSIHDNGIFTKKEQWIGRGFHMEPLLDKDGNQKIKKTLNNWLIWLLIGIFSLILCVFIDIQATNYGTRLWIESYKATSVTIDMSIESETFSGLERLELTDTIIEYNKELAKRQYCITRWWYWSMPNDLKQELLNLEPILIN